ncbi:DNA primase [Coprococcus catus GD/7]|uniref:DNA primase n=1 Tax=Coprococcus catus GD/7 TaxID=717962 RepID=D4J7V8_9FIRM|nr:DNA primase [Coprococcus catus]CBK80429.1 DNA primase [Coprococcus catus GD/7]
MYYPDEVIEEVRSSNNIVDIIGGYVRLQKKGSSYFGLCPFHNEKSPSFSVSPNKQMYYCFGCGAGGNVFTFIMEYENQTFPEAVKILADRAGIALPEAELTEEQKRERNKRQLLLEINKTAANYFYYLLNGDQGQQAREYLENRRMSKETQIHFGLGYASKYSNDLYLYLKKKGYQDQILKETGLLTYDEKRGAHDKFWNRVMFPIMDVNNRVIGFGGRVMGDGTPKYLNSPETMLFDKSRNLYGLNYARTSRKPYMIICEGYMDVIAMHQAGFTNAVASLGTAFTTQHSVLLKRYTQEVRLAYDSDGAGQKAALRAIPILKSAGINVRVIHMDPYKDPDEFIKNLGTEAFQERIDAAESSFMFEISVLEKNYKQSDPEGRASFMKAMARRLLEFPQELERNIYIDAIAGRYGIASEELKRMVNSFGASMSREQVEAAIYQQQEREEMPAKKRVEKEDSVLTAQKFFLTWLIEEPSIYDKTKDYINEDDFVEPLYHHVAALVFEELRATGQVMPARILNQFEDVEEQKTAASLFNTRLKTDDDPAVREKALNETVKRIKKNSLELKSRSVREIADLQKIIKEKAQLQKLYISL